MEDGKEIMGEIKNQGVKEGRDGMKRRRGRAAESRGLRVMRRELKKT